jgi:hypothetical protein
MSAEFAKLCVVAIIVATIGFVGVMALEALLAAVSYR